jgi:methylenetetrahydrofolate dehydrogenase (NADP+) / methenyltetrahydrofolate cyclohydrolase / formyltetrahydrofolate synthetase
MDDLWTPPPLKKPLTPPLPPLAGKGLDAVYKTENLELVAAGCANLQHHIRNAAKYGVRAVVAINKFVTDTDAEVRMAMMIR